MPGNTVTKKKRQMQWLSYIKVIMEEAKRIPRAV